MTLRDQLEKKHSKETKDKIVKWIGHHQNRFDELVNIFLHDKEAVIVQRAAWPLGFVADHHPELIGKHLTRLIKNLQKNDVHDAIKRNTIRLLQQVTIPEKLHGDVMNICFDYITSPREKPAIKAFALSVLQMLSRKYPDIRNEIKVIIEEQWDNESLAFRSRARKVLKEIAANH